MGRGALALSTLAVGIFAALPALATAVAPLPRIPDDAGPAPASSLKVKPGQIVWSPDGSHFFAGAKGANSNIRWRTWTAASGTASSKFTISCAADCVPVTYPAQLRVDHPRRVGGRLLFTELHVHFTGRRPGNWFKTSTWFAFDQAGQFGWGPPPAASRQ